MKKLLIFAVFLTFTGICFSENLPDEIEKEISKYLKALSSSNREAQLEALSKLNTYKTSYPQKKMKEFDNFINSKAMKETTDLWIKNLSHESAWIRHSTLHILVLLKSDCPQLDMSKFNKPLDKMITNDPLYHLQVDAKLAEIYLNDSLLSSSIKLNEDMLMEGDVFTFLHLEMDKMFDKQMAENL